MQTWKWLYHPIKPFDWRFVSRIIIKSLMLFVMANIVFVALHPMETIGGVSAYNLLWRGRDRLPYGENPAESFNLSLYNIPAMFASHDVGRASDDEYRVLIIGDSSTWGVLLRPEETLAGQLNSQQMRTADGRPVNVYNLGYPTMSLTKDLMLLDYALRYEPDLIIWAFTLQSFDQATQLDSAIVQNNPDRIRALIKSYDLNQVLDDHRFVDRTWTQNTVLGRRRALADLLRLQLYGAAWTVTGIDQVYPEDYILRSINLSDDETWQGYHRREFSVDDLAVDVLSAGVEIAGDVPVLLVNEPIFISRGDNSSIRYNAFYPRWAYDDFRRLLTEQQEEAGWTMLDLWNAFPDAECYTDSPVHLTPTCSAQLAELLTPSIARLAGGVFFEGTQ